MYTLANPDVCSVRDREKQRWNCHKLIFEVREVVYSQFHDDDHSSNAARIKLRPNARSMMSRSLELLLWSKLVRVSALLLAAVGRTRWETSLPRISPTIEENVTCYDMTHT